MDAAAALVVSDGDTIAAIATAAGIGGVGIVRLSGPRAIEIAAASLGIEAGALTREVRVGWARAANGDRLDQVLAFAMRAPASFTGEDVAELHGHGGAHNLNALLSSLVERGARIAEPGEFTRRAVANGKLDLARAEALLDVIHAGSERALRLARANLGGALGEHAQVLESRALALLAELEGRIDFPEEDIAPADAAWIASEIVALEAACATLVDGFRHGRAVSAGITVALVGPVNVGKSSLLNAMVGTERALVAAEPGTTRDWLEVSDVWNGVAVTLIDTAGMRDTDNAIEARGIELGARRVDSADVVVVINDGVSPWDDGARYGDRALVVRSKADLAPEERSARSTSALDGGLIGSSRPTLPGPLYTSARSREGLDELRSRVLAMAGVADREGGEQAFVTTARQQAVAAAARDAFTAAHDAWTTQRPPEVVAVELRTGAQALAQLRGIEVGERVLDEVFARFCIGK
jgi:tRNA modification GTPase